MLPYLSLGVEQRALPSVAKPEIGKFKGRRIARGKRTQQVRSYLLDIDRYGSVQHVLHKLSVALSSARTITRILMHEREPATIRETASISK